MHTGLPLFTHVLAPRTKGFVACAQNLLDHVDAVYDVTVAYTQSSPPCPRPTAPSMAGGSVCGILSTASLSIVLEIQHCNSWTAHVHIKRFDSRQLPKVCTRPAILVAWPTNTVLALLIVCWYSRAISDRYAWPELIIYFQKKSHLYIIYPTLQSEAELSEWLVDRYVAKDKYVWCIYVCM